jgi:nifR3 family TIM-barrel protein
MTLRIKGLIIDPPLALAPMVGLSHSALRSLVAEFGGSGLFYTEMLSAKRLPSENEKCSPFLIKTEIEKPLFYQIYASEHVSLTAALEKLSTLDAQGIDLNLGCPAPQLKKINAGQFLFKKRDAVEKIVIKLRSLTDLPLSVKIRIGKKPDRVKLTNVCQMLEHAGVDLITVHARLDHEKFCRKPRWEILQDATAKLKIPIFANGGIFTADDAKECLHKSGAAGLMIGRGAAARPWIFRDIAKQCFSCKTATQSMSKKDVFMRFIDLLEERFPAERRLGRLKQFSHYFATEFPFGHQFAFKIQNSTTMQHATQEALQFFNQ